jgi:DNA-binding NarL/FixJ family response regulator
VLLVEDSPILTQLLARMLGTEPDIEVVGHAERAASAIAAIRALLPDVVVLDLHLAEGSGYDVLQAAGPARARAQFLVLTNHTGAEHRAAALRAGATHFFDKGRDIPALLALVRKIAQTRTGTEDAP